ncbi:MAG TPA: hypothetical protein VLV50_18775 [Stellaceae bacterium]|nr:hypothetical protein [Stellaceae bacterium]
MLYVDGRLPRAREDAVATHLEANPREARRIGDYCRQNELLAALAEAIADELPRAGEERLLRLVARHAARARRRRAGVVAVALTVAVVTGLGTIQILHSPRSIAEVASARTTFAHTQPAALTSRER